MRYFSKWYIYTNRSILQTNHIDIINDNPTSRRHYPLAPFSLFHYTFIFARNGYFLYFCPIAGTPRAHNHLEYSIFKLHLRNFNHVFLTILSQTLIPICMGVPPVGSWYWNCQKMGKNCPLYKNIFDFIKKWKKVV